MHLTRDQSILAPNFSVELVNDDRVVPVEVDLNFYRGFLEGHLAHCFTVLSILHTGDSQS